MKTVSIMKTVGFKMSMLNTMKFRQLSRQLTQGVLGAAIASLVSVPALAWNMADTPLFWASGAQPNVMLLLDDSGSMHNITYSEAYGDYITTYSDTARQNESTADDDATDNFDTPWYWCKTMKSGSASLTTSTQGVNRCTDSSGMNAFTVATPQTTGSTGVISGTYINSNTPILCDVTYLNTANSGAGRGFKRAIGTTPSQNIGVMVTSASGTSQTNALQACVRIKEARTAVSPRSVASGVCVTKKGTVEAASLNPKCPSAIDGDTDYEEAYFQWLLTRNALTSQVATGIPAADNGKNLLINFSNTVPNTTTTGVADVITQNATYPNAVTATVTDPKSPRIIPDILRMDAARVAAEKVFTDNKDDLRIGLARFNGTAGANMTTQGARIGANATTVVNAIKLSRAEDNTPLTESLHEIIRYYMGIIPQESVNGTGAFASPIQYRCQKNFAVVLTDGDPTSDAHRAVCGNSSSTIPSKIGDLTGWPAGSMNYDGIADACIGSEEVVLDDMAQWAHDKDLRGAGSTTTSCYGGETPLPATGNDCTGKSWNNTDFVRQTMETYTIGFGLKNDVLVETPETARIDTNNNGLLDAGEPQAAMTLAPAAFSVAADTITMTGHGLKTGDKVLYRRERALNKVNVGGLVDQTNYYAVKVDANTIKLADTESNAKKGTPTTIDITTNGTGNNHVISRGEGRAFFALTADALSQQLASTFKEINKVVASASAVAASSGRYNSGSYVYQGKFNTEDWSGEVNALKVTATTVGTTTTYSVATIPTWSASSTVTAVTRATTPMYTWTDAAGKAKDFTYANLTAQQKLDINSDPNVVSWLKGNVVPGFRDRPSGIIGDVINSDPLLVGELNFGYAKLKDTCTADPTSTYYTAGTGCTGGKLYQKFVDANKVRPGVLYVGTNAGQLHALDATTGAEKMAFIPAGVYVDWVDAPATQNGIREDATDTVTKKLWNLTQPNYVHKFFVDGGPAAYDAWTGTSWKTLLTAGLNAGGRSVYTIDVTDGSFGSPGKILWEYSHPELGYTFSKPVIARLQSGQWAAIFGNGMDSGGDKAQLFIVDAFTGVLIRKIDTGVGSSADENGMASVTVSIDVNRTVTGAYGGDLQGNIWKFDLKSTDSTLWPAAVRLYQAKDSVGNPQPITGDIAVGTSPDISTATMVFFGTGKYFEKNDTSYIATTKPRVNTFYGVMDDKTNTLVSQANLVQQTLSQITVNGATYRTATTNPVNYKPSLNQRGWYVNLVEGSNFQNEKFIGKPLLHGGRIIFVTLVPESADRCSSGGSSYLMELDARTGGQLATSVLDTNGDGVVDDLDTEVAGKKFDDIISDPTILKINDKTEMKIMGSTNAAKSIETVIEAGVPEVGGDTSRMSWLQVQ